MRRVVISALATVAGVMLATPASASLVYDPLNPVQVQAQGFGNQPRSLTVQSTGNSTNVNESGCISYNGGLTAGSGSCIQTDAQGTGSATPNVGGDETHPFDAPKQAAPTVADLGWVSAADIGILFNATDPSGDGVNVIDLTLKFLRSDGTLLGAIDGSYSFTSTEVGNGGAGFIFTVSSDEQAYVNSILGLGGTIYTALETTIGSADGGPESYTIVNLHQTPAVPEPATWAMMLLGFGGMGVAMRRKRKVALAQIA